MGNYKTLSRAHGFIIVNQGSSGILGQEQSTPNLNENKLKIKLLVTEKCPINKKCISLVDRDKITHFCKYIQYISPLTEGQQDESHAHVVCGYSGNAPKAEK